MQSERKNKCSGTLDTPLAEDINWRNVERLLDEAETRSAEREEDFGRRYLNILFSSNWIVREQTRPKIEKMTPQETRAYVRAKRIAMERQEEERKREQHRRSLPRIPSPCYLHRHPPRDERKEKQVKKMLGEITPPPTPSVKGLSYSVEEASWVEDVQMMEEEVEEETVESSLASINRFLAHEDLEEEASWVKTMQSIERSQTNESSHFLSRVDLEDIDMTSYLEKNDPKMVWAPHIMVLNLEDPSRSFNIPEEEEEQEQEGQYQRPESSASDFQEPPLLPGLDPQSKAKPRCSYARFPWLVVDESKEEQTKAPETCSTPLPLCGLVSSEEMPGAHNVPSLPKQSWQPGSGSDDMLDELARSLPLDLPTDWDDDTEDDYAKPC